MSNWGIKYTTRGKEATKNANVEELGLTSAFNSLKIWESGRRSITTNGSGLATITINHNLGYIPAFNGYYKGTDGRIYPMMTAVPSDGGYTTGIKSTNSTIEINIYSDPNTNVDVFYEIFIEDLVTH